MNAYSKNRFCISHVTTGLVLLLILSGCSTSEEGPELIEAYGTITVDGKPQSYLQVEFYSEGNGSTTGLTDEDGEYTIEFNDTRKGAFPGKNRVVIVQASKAEFADPGDCGECCEDELEARIDAELRGKQLPAKYNDNTELTVDVTEGGAPYDFNLVTK